MVTECRDWIATLWQASYMGMPFFFESDDEEGGRTVAVHEYANSDDYDLEDTGQAPRYYSGSAYVHGDDADTQAIAFAEALSSPGPGTLVVPILGPIQVQALPWKRTAHKDQLGYIAFSVRFVRQSTSTPLVTTPLLGQLVFDAADTMAGALADLFPDALTLNLSANYVIAAAVDAVEGIAAVVEAVRSANPVDATISAQVAAANVAIVIAAPLLISAEAVDPVAVASLVANAPAIAPDTTDPTAILAAAIVATIRLLGDGMVANPDAGAGALLGIALYYPATPTPVTTTANAAAAAANAAAINDLARRAAYTAWCEALQRQTYPDRPSGVAARASAAERLGQELDTVSGSAAMADAYDSLMDLQGATVAFLTAQITNLAPVVTITAPRSMPAAWWAWRLYSDPTRDVDLVLRNGVADPAFMPVTFQALAPGYPAPASLPTAWPAA
jgi:prophage DNA circulation protein